MYANKPALYVTASVYTQFPSWDTNEVKNWIVVFVVMFLSAPHITPGKPFSYI